MNQEEIFLLKLKYRSWPVEELMDSFEKKGNIGWASRLIMVNSTFLIYNKNHTKALLLESGTYDIGAFQDKIIKKFGVNFNE